MEKTPKLEFEIAGFPIVFDVTIIITTTITCIIVFLLAYLATRKLSMVPKGIQNVIEMIMEFTQGIVRSNLDAETRGKFYGFAFTLFMFIFIANQLGLMFNVITEHQVDIPFLNIESAGDHGAEGEHHAYAWWKSPTADINVALSMALAITICAHILGIRKSSKGYVKHYFSPSIFMFPMHIVDELAKPMTHGMRLWANIFAGEILIAVLLQGSVLLAPALSIWLGYSFFVGTVQAFVFTVLAMVYFAQKLSTDH